VTSVKEQNKGLAEEIERVCLVKDDHGWIGPDEQLAVLIRANASEIIAALRSEREPAVLELEQQFMKLAANRQEIIQNAACAYMSPRPNGLWVPWVMVEELLSAYASLAGKGASQGADYRPNLQLREALRDIAVAAPEPSGDFVRVPREPTEAMQRAGVYAASDCGLKGTLLGSRDIYRAMLAASADEQKGKL
jgi:hypothetical protein